MKNPGPCGPGFLLILLHYTVSLVEGDAKFAAVEDGFVYLAGGEGVAALVDVQACGEQFVVECVVWLDTDGHDYYVSCERKSAWS